MRHRHRPAPLYQSLFRCDALCCLAVVPPGHSAADRSRQQGGLGGWTRGTSALVERSLGRGDTTVQRAGYFPLETGMTWSFSL